MSSRECQRCEGTTASGQQCSRRTCKYAKYCYQHTTKQTGLKVKKSAIPRSGQGLYTTRDIKPNTVITPYAPQGKLLTQREYDRSSSGYGVSVGRGMVLDGASTQSGIGRYANSCRAADIAKGYCRGNNAKLAVDQRRRSVNVKSRQAIKAGKEIFVAYGPSYWR